MTFFLLPCWGKDVSLHLETECNYVTMGCQAGQWVLPVSTALLE